MMDSRIYPAILLAACVPVVLSACAQFPGTKAPDVAVPTRLSHTCKNPNPGNIFREPDGGYHESFQGWLYRTEIRQGTTGWAHTYCLYGLDKAAPSNRPVYSVHYQMTGFNKGDCTVSGATVSCVRTPVIKQP